MSSKIFFCRIISSEIYPCQMMSSKNTFCRTCLAKKYSAVQCLAKYSVYWTCLAKILKKYSAGHLAKYTLCRRHRLAEKYLARQCPAERLSYTLLDILKVQSNLDYPNSRLSKLEMQRKFRVKVHIVTT